MEDHISRARAKAQSAEKKARSALQRMSSEDWEIDTIVDRITAIEQRPVSRKPELEAQGPGGFRIRLVGLGGWHLVAAIAAIAAAIAVVRALIMG